MAEADDAAGGPGLHAISPEGPLYRIGRRPDPWAFPDWANAGSDGTFGNRWDDPQGNYRVLYASSSRLGALVEVLARFRPDPHIVDALKEIEEDERTAGQPPGELEAAWLRRRCLGVGRVEGKFVEVGHSNSLAHLRKALASRVLHHGLDDLDAASIRLSAPRSFTQELSRYVYQSLDPPGSAEVCRYRLSIAPRRQLLQLGDLRISGTRSTVGGRSRDRRDRSRRSRSPSGSSAPRGPAG